MPLRDQLVSGIEQALRQGGKVRIAVHNQTQAQLGERAAGRMASSPELAAMLTFEVIPDEHQEQYPIGVILDA